MNILDLNLDEFRKKFILLSNKDKENIILNKELINKDNDFILFIFNVSDDSNKKLLLNNDALASKLLKSMLNKTSKINTISLEYQKLIINKPYIFLDLTYDDFFELLKTMNINIYKEFIEILNNYIYYNDIKTNNKLLVQIKEIYSNYEEFKKDPESNNNVIYHFRIKMLLDYHIDDFKYLDQLTSSFCTKKRNILELSRIETKEQLYVYSRLGIVVDKELFSKENLDKYNITLELIKSLNSKHILKIMEELKHKGEIDDTKLLITSIKMYCLFGIDNALKVINDKFTYSTPSSIQRASNFQFISERRTYRLTHPDEFLNYDMLEKIRKGIATNNPNVIKKIIDDKSFTVILFSELKENYDLYKNSDKFIKYVNETIKYHIDNRENNLKNNFQKEFYLIKDQKRNEITPLELYNLFKYFDPILTIINNYGNVEMDKDLERFLLGNTKVDNDCLLRIVLNKQGLEFDNEIINIINCFHEILNKKSELKFNSKYSLLDILDIYKTIQYNLQIDELDIPLSMISKTALSKKHLNVSMDEAIDNFKRIYKEHKKKFYSTIPRVKGICKNNYMYKVLDKNDPELITCGIDTGSCFKPGGPGGTFYEYCLTSPYADVISIKDPENNMYIIPIIRNGNGVYGNGIDPENIPSDKIPFIIEALKKCYSEIIRHSLKDEKIDFCTITNLHKYISKSDGYNEFNIKDIPMIGGYFYSDILKNEITNYVLVGDASNVKLYVPEYKYFIPRTKNYIYSPEQIENKLVIEQKINEIKFQSIDYKPIDDEMKNKLRKNFEPIDVNKYTYIVCNEDWYLAINDSYELETAILPYDPRAKEEFFSELGKLKKNNENINNMNI